MLLSGSAPGFGPGRFALPLQVGGNYTVCSLEQILNLATIAHSQRVHFLTLEEQ
jgi:hypothetical protein